MSLVSRYVGQGFGARLRKRVLPYLGPLLTKWQVRRCRCCNQLTLFLQFGPAIENRACVRCAASYRYEMLGAFLRQNYSSQALDVLELDPNSSLRPFLEVKRSYTRTYYRPDDSAETTRQDGSVMQDITRLTLPDASLDLIVSSDVLEHVPDAEAAFRESFRVLRPGGAHVFTVPPEPRTVQRAVIEHGSVRHLVTPPEYHSDPLDPQGILAFWHFGPDLQQWFGRASGLTFTNVEMDKGNRRSLIWEAKKSA
jgi:SAM-dependent methyltransferase